MRDGRSPFARLAAAAAIVCRACVARCYLSGAFRWDAERHTEPGRSEERKDGIRASPLCPELSEGQARPGLEGCPPPSLPAHPAFSSTQYGFPLRSCSMTEVGKGGGGGGSPERVEVG